MRTFLFIILISGFGLNHLPAQKTVKISEVDCYNLGDGRYYCQDEESEKPLQGSMRMINGYTSEYTEAVFKDGIPDGSWKHFKNNALIVECTYREGILDGDYIEYYEGGGKKSVRHFDNGKPEGKFIDYAPDGKIEKEVNFKDGLQDGAEITYDREGNVRSSVNYSDGKETGAKKQSFSDYELTDHYNSSGQLDGDYSEIYTNGNVKVTGHYTAGKKDGTWELGKKDGNKIRTEVYADDDKIKETIYFTDGTVETVRELKNGKKNGWERTYNFREGTLKNELFYRDGEIASTATDANGNASGLVKQTKQMTSNYGVWIVTFYENKGKYEGEYTEQWAEGDKAMKTKGQYENGKKTGLWVSFDMYGNKTREENFVNVKLDGRQTFYEGKGIIDKYYTYKNDVRDGEYGLYTQGKLREKGAYVNGRIEGLSTSYYPDGTVKSEILAPHNPEDERIEKDYYPSGKLKVERQYENRSPVSEKQYFENGKIRWVFQANENGSMVMTEEYDETGKKIK
jgi:antitoxin component YwqK of YwqJK toxin-antitoxin module